MSGALARAHGLPGDAWPIGDDDPFARDDRLPDGVDPGLLSRFGDDRWDLSPLHPHGRGPATGMNWALFPQPLRSPFRRAGWALVNLPTPAELLERSATSRVKWPALPTMTGVARSWLRFARWLAGHDITRLCDVTTDDLEDYAVHVASLAMVRRSAAGALCAVSLLWGFAPHLPEGDRICMPPWEGAALKDYLAANQVRNENATPPIHPAVMSPLLIWALRFVEDFAGDICAAVQEHQRLTSQIQDHPSPSAGPLLQQLLDQLRSGNRPLPGGIWRGRHFTARTYLAGLFSTSKDQVKNTIAAHGKDVPVSTETPLDTPVRGQLHGQAWKPHINFHDVPALSRMLTTAAMIVILYLSGMRPGEGLRLEAGCCPEPDDDGTGSLRYEIRGNVFKGIRDEEGTLIPDGKPREVPWAVIPPVVHAIRVLEHMADGPLLFPAEPAPIHHHGPESRTGEVLTCGGASHRIQAFINWINDFAGQHGLDAERIPRDPDGPISVSRFRRTVAWHIARLPGGRIALAIQYGHLRASPVTEGYSGRARHGLRRVLDIETARAMADHLDDIADRIRRGEGISGPAARRMIKAAEDAVARFEGMVLSPRQADALLTEPQFQVYDNPEAFLTCNHDPVKALCHPDRTASSRRGLPPAIERCDPACANIARTDTHITKLRNEVGQLSEEITSPLTPGPLRERLKQRVTALQQIVDRHEQTRITLTQETDDDR